MERLNSFMIKKKYFISILIVASQVVFAQTTKKVLFIGNSYTAVNNLPTLVSEMATNTGDNLIYDSNTPGGYRLMNHATNATTLSKINANDWDYVVLQAQSQEASLSQNQMTNEVFPYATVLSNAIRQNNPCSQPLFYMTWGRQNGDPGNCTSLPWVCTYVGMDDVIRNSYLYMTQVNNAEVTPAGAVWRYLRSNNPSINLYSSDESHPSLEGSYAAACAFYTMIYKKDPTLITWNSTLSSSVATAIKQATKIIVYDQLASWDFTTNSADANFTENIQQDEVAFINTSGSFDSLLWNFGDGNSSTEDNPTHNYAANGFYTVSLKVTKCGKSDIKTKVVSINADLTTNKLFEKNPVVVFPNPTEGVFQIKCMDKLKKATFEIYDVKGTKFLTKEIEDVSYLEMNIDQLNSGIYFLKLTTGESTFYSKILKN